MFCPHSAQIVKQYVVMKCSHIFLPLTNIVTIQHFSYCEKLKDCVVNVKGNLFQALLATAFMRRNECFFYMPMDVLCRNSVTQPMHFLKFNFPEL